MSNSSPSSRPSGCLFQHQLERVMKSHLLFFTQFFVVSLIMPASAQPLSEARTGPVIADYGAVYEIENPDLPTPTDMTYRMLFDVKTSPDAADGLNASLNTVARFLNMHAQAGVSLENMKTAIILHGSAGKYVLDQEAYKARFGVRNTNLEMMEALHDAGVEIYICGQTATHRGYAREDMSPIINVALSAMTVIAKLESEGYTVVGF